MKLAIMQPYLFPYIGYFQLINAVDKFVVYDDVNFINKGWINRNKILINGCEYMFTVPLAGASQNRLIKDIEVDDKQGWREGFMKMIEKGYGKAPYFGDVKEMVKGVVFCEEKLISKLILKSLEVLCGYLDIGTEIIVSSEIYDNGSLKGVERIFDICNEEKANHYINPIGGVDLYPEDEFAERGVELRFLKSKLIKYDQFGAEFVSWLSIIDILMFNSKERAKKYLGEYEFAS